MLGCECGMDGRFKCHHDSPSCRSNIHSKFLVFSNHFLPVSLVHAVAYSIPFESVGTSSSKLRLTNCLAVICANNSKCLITPWRVGYAIN